MRARITFWLWLSLPCAAAHAEEPAAEPQPLPVIAVADEDEAGAEAAVPADEAAELEPIAVTATRTPRLALDVPESVSVVDRARLDALGAATLGGALDGLAGVAVAGGPRAAAESLNLRGLGGTRVLLTVDGVRQNFDGAHRSRLLVDPELLKSVEVLRGPASALWGSDALGGVVSLTTRDAADLLEPGQALGARLRLGYAGADAGRARGGTVFGRVGATDLLADMNRRDAGDLTTGGGTVLPHSALGTDSALVKGTHALGDAHQLGVSVQRYADRGRSPSNAAREVADDNPLLDRGNVQRYAALRYSFADAGADAPATAGVTLYRSDLDIVEDRVGEPRHDALAFATTGASAQSSFERANGRLSLGAEAYGDASQALRDGAPRPQFPDARRRVIGAYAQHELEWGDVLLTPGLRWDRFVSRSNTGAGDAVRADALSKKLGLRYALAPALSLTGAYAEAFRAPSLLETYAQGQHFLGNEFRPNPGLRPERARNAEVGLRARLHDAFGLATPWVATLALYDNRIRDYIETVVMVETEGPVPPAAQCVSPTPAVGCVNRNDDGTLNPAAPPIHVGGYTTSANLTRARIRGLELESRWQSGPWHARAAWSHIRGDNLDAATPLLSIPADALHLETSLSLAGATAGVRLTRALAQDRVPLDADGAAVAPPSEAYTVAGLFASWESPRAAPALRLDVGADNLFDANYRPHLASNAQAGRSLRAAFTYRF